jgi:hypothetical protein
MASTVENSTLTVRISEEVELNNKKLGSSNIHKIKNINEVSERIITSLTTGTTLLSLGAAAGAGTFVRDNVKYIRLTNLDNTNFVRLALITDGTDVHVKLPALDSFLLYNGSAASNNADANSVTFESIESIKAWADTAAVDIELFVACS